MARNLRNVVLVLASAVATVVAADRLLQRVCPLLRRRMEAEDGIALVRSGDPETLILGSSHGRSFIRIAAAVSQASGGKRLVVPVPVEYGKLSSYAWVLDHRLRPLLEETGQDGRPLRPSLRRFLLVTEWFDACAEGEPVAFNVPARGFTVGDFLADAARRGLDDWNQNYLDQRWNALWRGSLLIQDRGVGRAVQALRSALGRRVTAAEEAARYEAYAAVWRNGVERAATDPRCRDPRERAALEHMLGWAAARHLDTTLLLFPRKPDILTERARATTLRSFSEEMRAVAGRWGVRFVDYTAVPPIGSGDFMADFDHLNAEGNEKFERWALGHELAFLLEPPRSSAGTARR
jgi:hypothetical protein